MNQILKEYYHININIYHTGYFQYNNEIYYIEKVNDYNQFITIFNIYMQYTNQLSILSYILVPNVYNEYYSDHYILFKYTKSNYSLTSFLMLCMQPLYMPYLSISDIKEQWILKIDHVRKILNEYEFKSNQEVIPLIHYYLGIGETCISLLNIILKHNPKSSLPLSLSLKMPISYDDKNILNPCFYTLSTKERFLTTLLKSEILKVEDLSMFFKNLSFEYHEYIYFYARLLYPTQQYDAFLQKNFEIHDLQLYKQNLYKELSLYKDVYDFLNTFISLPKICWINNSNMI